MSAAGAAEAQIQALLHTVCPLYAHIGMSVEHARGGLYRCRVPLTPANINHLGTVHAALQWTLGEVSGGLVILSIFPPARFAQLYAAVTWVECEFLKPARGALIAEARMTDAEHDRVRAAVDAGDEGRFGLDIAVSLEGSGEVVAKLKARYIVRPRRKD
jgi:acyl-coenzyme A thioesterase PaaI-like protein